MPAVWSCICTAFTHNAVVQFSSSPQKYFEPLSPTCTMGRGLGWSLFWIVMSSVLRCKNKAHVNTAPKGCSCTPTNPKVQQKQLRPTRPFRCPRSDLQSSEPATVVQSFCLYANCLWEMALGGRADQRPPQLLPI